MSFPDLPLHLYTAFHILAITVFVIVAFVILWNLWTLVSLILGKVYDYLSLAFDVVYFPIALVVNTFYIIGALVLLIVFLPLLLLWCIAGVLWSGVLKKDLRWFLYGDEDVEIKSVCGPEEDFEDSDGKDGYGDRDADGGDEWQHTDTDYESSDEEEEEGVGDPSHQIPGDWNKEIERPRTPPDKPEEEIEKVDSVMRGVNPKARAGYTSGS